MKFSYFTFLLLLIINISCGDSSTPPPSKPDQAPGKINKPPSSFSDTLIINSPSAVFYYPDSLQLEKIKRTTDRNVFASEEHNCFYQMRNARIVLEKYWPDVRIIESTESRFLLFLKKDKSHTLVDLNAGEMCGLYLFDGQKQPELADMMNIDTALGFYFSR